MSITVIYGLPGSGKTHLINNDPRYAQMSHVDIAEAYRIHRSITWREGVHWVVQTTLIHMQNNHDVVIEGLFLPGTPSHNLLNASLRNFDAEWIQVHASLQVCEARIKARKQDNEKICLHILSTYFNRAEAIYRKMLARNYYE